MRSDTSLSPRHCPCFTSWCFFTCSTLHFYNLKCSLSAPQMMVVTELEEPFLPLPDDLLVNLGESRVVLDALLDSLPATFASNSVVDCATGPALQVLDGDIWLAGVTASFHLCFCDLAFTIDLPCISDFFDCFSIYTLPNCGLKCCLLLACSLL